MMIAPALARAVRIGGNLGAGGGQDEVCALEIELVQVLDRHDVVFAERHLRTDRAIGRQAGDRVDRKLAFRQDIEQLATTLPVAPTTATL